VNGRHACIWYNMCMPINWSRRKYTEEQFRDAWLSSNSVMECLRTLGLNEYGSAHQIAKDTARELGLDNSHMTGRGWLKGKTHSFSPSRPLNEILVYGKKENNTELKKKLVRAGLKEWKCERCGLDSWLGEKITIELEHVDGDNKNNTIENLMFLCPNCHSYTDTWRGRNIKSYGRLDKLEKSASSKDVSKEGNLDAGSNPAPPTCSICGIDVGRKSNRCMKCYRKTTEKIKWPETEDLIKMLSNSNYSKLSKELGVSDNALRKRIKNHSERSEGSNPSSGTTQ
jgi:hypothetical protein